MANHRLEFCAPSEWDVILSPELAPLFVIDAGIVAAQRFFSILLDPSSFGPGGTDYRMRSANTVRRPRTDLAGNSVRTQRVPSSVRRRNGFLSSKAATSDRSRVLVHSTGARSSRRCSGQLGSRQRMSRRYAQGSI